MIFVIIRAHSSINGYIAESWRSHKSGRASGGLLNKSPLLRSSLKEAKSVFLYFVSDKIRVTFGGLIRLVEISQYHDEINSTVKYKGDFIEMQG